MLLLFAPCAHASVQEIRVVAVGIDTESMAAEAKALDYARKRAVYLAARKLGVKDLSKVVSKFTDEQFNQIIRGATVVQTRRQGEVTYSEVNVTVVDEALERALKIPEKPAVVDNLKLRGVMLLPVFATHDRAYMWEKENQLREPLNDEVRRQSHAGILLPSGDLQDLRLVDYQNALTVKPEEMKTMFDRYGAEEIVIAVLTPSASGTADPASVLLRRLRSDNTVRNELLEITPENSDEPAATRLSKAAVAIASAVTQIASSTAERDQTLRAKSKQVKVRFSYAIPRDLAMMEEAVRNDAQVLYLDLPSIALAQVTGTIYLKGDDEVLRQDLTKQGIIIRPINDGWQLSIR